jgi:hypothetical protein
MKKNRALQQNMGARYARGHVLLFLHADTRLPHDYVNQVFDLLMDPRILVGAFRFKTDLKQPVMRFIEFTTNFRSRYIKFPYGDQGLFVRSSHFHRQGGFPLLPIAEDLFFVKQYKKKGRIGITPAYAITSARRWTEMGVIRASLINQMILMGFMLGISPSTLASIYHKHENPSH